MFYNMFLKPEYLHTHAVHTIGSTPQKTRLYFLSSSTG